MRDSSAQLRRYWVTAVLGVTVTSVFALTARWGPDQNGDAIAAALPAWSFAAHGTLDLGEGAAGTLGVIEIENGHISNRPPGVWLAAALIYFISDTTPEHLTYWPATAAAVLTTGLATVLLHRLLLKLTDVRTATIAALVFALGTSTWSISANQLWPHGTVQFWLAASMLFMANARWAASGLSFGLAALARPVTAVIAFVHALLTVYWKRDVRAAVKTTLGAGIGLVAIIVYNWKVFGRPSLTGGYPSDFVDRLWSPDLSAWAVEFAHMFLNPRNGILLWSPVLLVLLPGLRDAWKAAPHWVRSASASGVVYLVLHALLNRASGGLAFGYRYQLASVTLALPLLVLAWAHWGSKTSFRRVLVVTGTVVSVAAQAALIFTLECLPINGSELYGCSLFQF